MENMKMPEHIAIIMDGNRRWAKSRNLPIKMGHKQGAETLKAVVRYANKIGLKYITVYAFSTENWKRSEDEVNSLMNLLQMYLDDFVKDADTENIVIRVLGDLTALSKSLQAGIKDAVRRTENNNGIVFNIALNYGGRDEIVHAVRKISQKVASGEMSIDEISEQTISDNLYTYNIPDPDLLIRTSGEIRLSGFLPWQSVYTELLFIEKLWPDFNSDDLDNAIVEFNKRKRNFGAN
jgi:undecaprenyl diphosphate synthase